MGFRLKPFLIINLSLAIMFYILEMSVEYFDPGTEEYMKLSNSANAVFFNFFFWTPIFFIVLLAKNGAAIYLKKRVLPKVNIFFYYLLFGIIFSAVYSWMMHDYSVFIYPLIPLLETLLFGFLYENKNWIIKEIK
ncbi:hypothetical protein [Brevibacillus sp. 179-C 1.1 NHS]|uniref:hypothetical protein n=1 Tax=Brevibacillus sp. 179-C 1.1 NHS TaxID=3235177 RepID=UPI0039A294B4